MSEEPKDSIIAPIACKKDFSRACNIVEDIIFLSKYTLLIFYFGLIVALAIYAIKFLVEVWHIITIGFNSTEQEFMLAILTLVDMVMIANLIKMIVSGSYQTFIRKLDAGNEHITHESRVSSGVLKVKMASSIIGVCCIYLLRDFINSKDLGEKMWIVGVFLVSTIVLAIANYLHEKEKALDRAYELASNAKKPQPEGSGV